MQELQDRIRNSIVERLARAHLSPQEHAIRKAILTAFAQGGPAPGVPEVALALGLTLEDVRAGFRRLADADLIVWTEVEARIRSAYPFSGIPTAHRVLLDGRTRLYALCAIDALGIPVMLKQGVRIDSTCFVCHTPVTVAVHASALHSVFPLRTVVWYSEQDGCCVAEARCPRMNFFCDAGHLQAWRATASEERGTSLSVMEAFEVGKAVFGELLT